MTWKLRKVISGGQTGADLAGLFAGKQLGYATGGAVPKGWRTETGPNLDLRDLYGCHESCSSRYDVRTLDNVIAADATVIFGDLATAGSSLTRDLALTWKRPLLMNPTAAELREWIWREGVQVANVAGNRESRNIGIYDRTVAILLEGLRSC